jgi:hypothetical protein
MLRTQVKALSAATVSAMFMQALLSMESFVTSDLVGYMADTAMIRLRAISPDAGKRVDNRMVSIDTFLSVGTTGARLLGRERSCPDPTFLPHLRSIVVKAYGAAQRRAGREFVRSPRH